ncbi:hypothetical protein BN1723_006403 [Verticillium longisporum]|uniref:Stc1 domain-containing protein n=1 Tax=Verticillium longisporum TaxID=100787 RepID=A0A0G4NF23_VERLO|nr:hypothetical protein BN1708_015370 [Verticillium longisporum]CRK45033.1 hypothetical protein BN1723_006403 [Verticillium longisporum]
MTSGNNSQSGRLPGNGSNPTQMQRSGPTSFRCDVGGEWKPLDGFSKRFQKMSLKPRFDPARSGMICRVHSGEPALEAKCNGPCGRVLPLNSFSKSSRSKGVHLCIQCQSWISTQDAEDGRTPIAAPSHERDFDEQINGVRLPLVPDLYAEYAGLDEDDDYDEELIGPTNGMAANSFRYGLSEASSCLEDTASVAATTAKTSSLECRDRLAPPHLWSGRARGGAPSDGKGISAATSDWVPPHLRGARPLSPKLEDAPALPATYDAVHDMSNTRDQWAQGVKARDQVSSLMAFSEMGPSRHRNSAALQENCPSDQSTAYSSNEYYKSKRDLKNAQFPAQLGRVLRSETSTGPHKHRTSSPSAVGQTSRRDKWGKASESRLKASDLQSISTATTFRQEQANQPMYNAWDHTGARHTRPRPPPSTIDGTDSVFEAVAAQECPTPFMGGFARGFAAQRNLNGQDDSDDDFQNALRTMKLAEQKIVYNCDCEHSDDEDVM